MENESIIKFDLLRKKAELLISQNKDIDKNISYRELNELIHELKVYQIELELQNEELRNIQKQLEDTRNSYKDLFDYAPNGHVILSDIGQIIQVNKTFAYMVNSEDTSNFIWKNFNDFIFEEDKSEFLARYKSFYNNPEGKTLELRLKRFNSTPIIVLIYGRIIIDKYINKIDNNRFLLLSIVDITERKLIEGKLKERESELSSIINAKNIYVIKTDIQGNFTYVNKTFREKFQWIYGNTEIIGKNLIESVYKEEQKKVFELINKCINQPNIPFEIEIRNPFKDGLQYTSYWNFICTLNNKGEPSEILCIGFDITNRKKVQEEKSKLLTAIEQSRVSVVITDINGNIEYVNNFFTELTGYSKNEVLGHNPRILNAGKHTKDFYKELWTTILNGNTWEGIFYNKKKNGQLYWEYAIITPIKDEIGKIINFVAVKEDITEKIIKEQQLNQYKEKLEQLVEKRTSELQRVNKELLEQIQKEKELEARLQEALLKEKEINELKTRFFASVSHEFRTPLSAILTSSQMIKKYGSKWPEEKLETHYQNIDKMINHLTKLLDDIMLISRAEREILKNNPKEEDINLLFKEIISEHSQTLQKNRKINFHNNCNQCIYNVDSKLIKHIIGNLLSNSIKYGYENTDIDLSILEEGNQLVIKVEDRGIGIDEIDLKNIFEPFYRAKNSYGIKGTGLGLNIVKRCVDLLGGIIDVESKLNVGTKFTVRIPLQ